MEGLRPFLALHMFYVVLKIHILSQIWKKISKYVILGKYAYTGKYA